MKVKELQEVLARIEPDAEFNIYDIARRVDVEDLKNTLECLGYDNIEEIGYDKLTQMNDDVQDRLANDDVYNQCYIDAVLEVAKENNFEQQLKEDMKMSNVKVYESNTKGKEAFVKEALTPIVQQYGYSVASYTGEDGKDEKVWLFKRSDRKIGFIDDAQFAVDVTADSVTALFEDVLRRIGVIPDMRELLDKTSLIKACLNYIQSNTETCEEFANVMLRDLGMTKDEIEEYGKGYCLDVLEEQD